jgi:DNA-binding NtrC family response regulator
VRVLVVEDDEGICEMLVSLLQIGGHEVTIASDVDDLTWPTGEFKASRLSGFGAAVIDVNLSHPTITGRDVLAWLHDVEPDTHRVAFTGSVIEAVGEAALLAHVVVEKPATIAEILAAIEQP